MKYILNQKNLRKEMINLKRVKLFIILLFCIFFLTACGEEKDFQKVGAMHYESPAVFKSVLSYDFGDETEGQVVVFSFDDENKKINLEFDASKKIEEEYSDVEFEQKKIHDKVWKMTAGLKDEVSYEKYFLEYQGDLYSVEFTDMDSFLEDEVETFLSNLSFEE